MMTKKPFPTLLFPLLFLLAILAGACENEIPFNLKENPPKLVINALINADSVNNKLYLHLTGPNKLKEVKEAIVEIRVNGTLTEVAQTIPPNETNFASGHYLITTAFHPGEVVRIDAHTANGEHHAWAEVTVPERITIGQVDTISTRIRYNSSNQDMMRYRFTIKDRPKERNYYRLVMEQRGELAFTHTGDEEIMTMIGKINTMVSSGDVVLTDGQPNMDNDNNLFGKPTNIYGIFDDSRLTDQPYTMTVYTSKECFLYNYNEVINKWWKVDVYIRLLSITETEFYYLKALNLIDSDVFDETMMEPVKFASNVHGGTGIVGISTETSVKIGLPKKIYQ